MAIENYKCDFAAAQRFLDLIDPRPEAIWTFQTVDDRKDNQRYHLTRVLHASRANLAAVLQQLAEFNAAGAAIYLTINETDGTGRRGENIVRVRALFVDLDGAPLQPVLDWDKPPHIVVITSPDRFHCYWLPENMPLEDFPGTQEALIEKFGGDPGVKSVERCMRVPGFYHCKSAPVLSLIHTVNSLPLYPAAVFPVKPQPVRQQTSNNNNDKQAPPLLVAAAVAAIPNPDLHHDIYKKIGLAIWMATGGAEIGYYIFDAFARRASARKYNALRTRKHWDGMHRSPPGRIGYGSLRHRATQADPDWEARLELEFLATNRIRLTEQEWQEFYKQEYVEPPPAVMAAHIMATVARVNQRVLGSIEALGAPATDPASYEVLGPAPPGDRCVRCGKGSGVKRIKHGGKVDLLHEGCTRDLLAAMANPPVTLPDLGPDPLDEHGAPLGIRFTEQEQEGEAQAPGTLFGSEASPDSAAVTGEVSGEPAPVMQATEASDTIAFQGIVITPGLLHASEVPDIAAFVLFSPGLYATEAPDIVAFKVIIVPVLNTQLIVSSRTFIANFVPPDYLIDGWLLRRFIYSMTGLTGSGKTAIALYLTALVAWGLQLLGREVQQGKVLYLAGENPDDVRMRWIKQCEEMHLNDKTDQVFWRDGTMLLGHDNVWGMLMNDCREAGPFAMVVVDTAAAYYTGTDENDRVQMGWYAQRLRAFIKGIKGEPTVLVPAHPTKNAAPENLLPAGGGSFLNSMDGNLTCVKKQNISEVHWLGKFRGPEFAPLPFILKQGTTEKLKDSKGRLLWTVTARPLWQAEHAAQEATHAHDEDQLLKLLVDRPGLSLSSMAEALGWFFATGEPAKSRAKRVMDALVGGGLAKKVGDRWQATKAGKTKAQTIHSERGTAEGAF